MTGKLDRRQFLIAGGTTVVLASGNATSTLARSIGTRVLDLRVDYQDRPLGLENRRPKLTWRIESHERSVRQCSYRVLVASDEATLRAERGDLWDSSKVDSTSSLNTVYLAKNLRSRQRCWWRVQIWIEGNEIPIWSDPSWWEMGMLEPSDWIARWLAVEDSVQKADRETGLHWIWSEPSPDKASRKFRMAFDLPVDAIGGETIVVVNDWHWWTQIGGIWLDGEPLIHPRPWVDPAAYSRMPMEEACTLARLQLPLRQLQSGPHLFAIEVHTGDFLPHSSSFLERPTEALAFFTRLQLRNGETLRIGSRAGWKSRVTRDHDWFSPSHDDTSWSAAVPRSIEGYQPWPARAAMQLRQSFAINQRVSSARLYATALGAYESYLNGQRVGDALLTPEPSQYARRVLYRTYDVTAMLQHGQNVIGIVVGDGWYASFDGRFSWAPPPRRILAQLEIILADGQRQVIATAPDWRISQSPVCASEIKLGETYDALLEQPGWDTPGFDDRDWPVADIAESPSCRLVSHTSPPIRVIQTLKPRAISQPQPGIYVVDFGQHFTGFCRLHTRGQKGARIELKFSEVLTTSGYLTPSNSSDPAGPGIRRDTWILKGDPAGETFVPRYSYRGFRYVEISGLEQVPSEQSIEGLFIHSDLAITGRIRTDEMLIEQIWRNIVQTQRSNFVGIPTDNCVREFRGYTGDAAAFWDTASFNMDICAFTSRYIDNLIDDQTADGSFPIFSPKPRFNNNFYGAPGTPPGWGDAGIIIPWTVWQRYGDLAIVEKCWHSMSRQLQSIVDCNPDFIWKHRRNLDFGDWFAQSAAGLDAGGLALLSDPEAVPTTPLDLIGTAYWAYSTNLLSQMASATGRAADAMRLQTQLNKIRTAFNSAFVNDEGIVGNGSQTSYILALAFGLLPLQTRQRAADHLAAEIRHSDNTLTAGLLGVQFVLDALTTAGHVDLAHELLLRTEYPSWGYMIRNGATTIWESWDGGLARNQYLFATIGGFLFRRVAGIDAGSPGFETIVIRPTPSMRVKRGGGDYDSVMGRISTDWTQESNGRFSLLVTLPANTSARIHLPAKRASVLSENGRGLGRRRDIVLVCRNSEEAVIQVGSGIYQFSVANL